MTKTNQRRPSGARSTRREPRDAAPSAQIALLELPPAPPRAQPARRAMSASMTARHCNALLAELDRVAEQRRRAQSLADLFEAAERAHDLHGSPERPGSPDLHGSPRRAAGT